MSTSVSGASVEVEAAARRGRVRRWARWGVGAAGLLVVMGFVASYVLRPRPFNLLLLTGQQVHWAEPIRNLWICDVDDPSGRHLFLQGQENHPYQNSNSIWRFDLEREDMTAQVTGSSAAGETRHYSLYAAGGSQDGMPVWVLGHLKGKSNPNATEYVLDRARWHVDENILESQNQLWRWNLGRGRLEFVRRRSPAMWAYSADGKLWLDLQGLGEPALVRDAATDEVRASFACEGGGRLRMPIWLADSKSVVLFGESEVRWVSVDAGKVLWRRTHEDLCDELLGGPDGSVRGAGTTPKVLWQFYPYVAYDEDRTLIYTAATRNYNPRGYTWPGEFRAYVWELPANQWTPAGLGGFQGATVDRLGRFRIDFVAGDMPGKHGATMVVKSTIPAGGTQEVLARGVPAARCSRIVRNPDRLCWLTEKDELWVLGLDGKSEATRVWPKGDVGRARGSR